MKRIAVINDLSGFGKCSLSVALPILSVMGHECNPLPTAILSNQTGFDNFYSVDFTPHLAPYIDVWKNQNAQFDAVLTGYLGSDKQVDIILDFIDTFGKNALIFTDPVMADDGVLYDTYSNELCRKMKKLTEKANIITPNLTELCILCGEDYGETVGDGVNDKICRMAKSLLGETTKTVIVTGIKSKGEVTNLIAEGNGISTVKMPLLNGSFSGTGDIFSSVVCGGITAGKTVKESVELATGFIYRSIKNTPTKLSYEPHGVNFQKYLGELTIEKA